MNTVDQMLIELYNSGIEKLNPAIPARDKKILSSLSRQIISGHFLTENQGKLLVKILKENKNNLSDVSGLSSELLDSPSWSKSFRILEQFRKIYLLKEGDGKIIVEFTYNKKLRQKIADLTKLIEGQMASLNTKQYSIPLTEKNVYSVVKTFKPLAFEVDQILMDFFQEISEIIEKRENVNNVFELKNEKLIAAISADIGSIDESNLLLLNDRKFRYQYDIFSKIPPTSLKIALAQRETTRVWVNSETESLENLVSALVDLKRLPLLVVFNGHDSKESLENLKKLSVSLEKLGITDNIGIYFRFDNSSPSNKDFNTKVSMLGYNKNLNSSTNVVGISNNKLPKFMLNSSWEPKSIITFSNNFKNNKTSLYGDGVDLIVFYNDKKPFGDINAIM